jgi:hypothetical protein
VNFSQKLYLGFERQTWPASVAQKLPVSSLEIETAGEYAGSSYVLEMGKHYDEYVKYDWEAPKFKKIGGFPTGPSLGQLNMKARSAGITGNIGETVAGIVAFQTLQCDSKDIAHLVVQSKQKTPDFLIRCSVGLRSILLGLKPSLASQHLPSWWPLESKIRSAGINDNIVKEGLWQLAALWYRMKDDAPADIGYGIVVGVGLQKPRQIRIHVFLPESDAKQQALLNHLKSFDEPSGFVESDIGAFAKYLVKYG